MAPKIAIIGAGPASLTLANILQNHSISFTIYEASSTIRTSGGSLDLRPDGGIEALKQAGLWEEFIKHARAESDVMKLVDLPTGEVLWNEDEGEAEENKQEEEGRGPAPNLEDGHPEIDREKLMDILLGNIKPESLKLGKKLQQVVVSTSSSSSLEAKHDLHFTDGTTESGWDLVIGGDGAWSRVRALLSDQKLEYSGITLVELWAHDAASKHPWLAQYTGKGSMFSFGKDRAVQSQTQGDGSIRIYASLRAPEDFVKTCGIDWEDKDAAREAYTKEYFSHVAPELQRLIRESTDNIIARPLYQLPVGFSWLHHPGVTLIGDAAHVMTPFAGVGVNAGMLDGLKLADAIRESVSGGKTLQAATEEYEKELFPRAEEFASKTQTNLVQCFEEGGAKKLAEFFEEVMREHK